MNPLAWLNPGRWLAVLLALAAVGWGGVYIVRSIQQTGYTQARDEYNRAALRGAEQSIARLQSLQTRNEEVNRALQTEKKRRADDGRAADDTLRLLNAALGSDRAAAPGPASPASGADGEAGLVKELFASCARSLVGLAREADRLEARLVGLQQYVREVCRAPP